VISSESAPRYKGDEEWTVRVKAAPP
jgi:hypothetical protein